MSWTFLERLKIE